MMHCGGRRSHASLQSLSENAHGSQSRRRLTEVFCLREVNGCGLQSRITSERGLQSRVTIERGLG